jgi:hypothetical protein
MSRDRDTEPPPRTPDRAEALAGWIERVFELFKTELKWSRSRTIDASKVSRAAVYKWYDPSEKGQFPEPASLDKFCSNLSQFINSPLLSPEVPYGILGWGKPGAVAAAMKKGREAETPTALEGKIRRAKLILKSKTLSDQEREKFRALLTGYERAYEGMLDQLIEEFERDIDPSRE